MLSACGGGAGSQPTASAPPAITQQPASVSTSPGASVSFTAVAQGDTPIAFQWMRDGADIPGATAGTYTTPPVTLGDSGAHFSVRISNPGGSTVSDAAVLTVTSSGATVAVGTLVPGVRILTESEEASISAASATQVLLSAGRQTHLRAISRCSGRSRLTRRFQLDEAFGLLLPGAQEAFGVAVVVDGVL